MNTKSNIASINRPTKYNPFWSYFFFDGKEQTWGKGFASRKEALAALNSNHPINELLSVADYDREYGYALVQNRRANCVYTNYATNG